jgi:hypothetical protein
MLCNPKGAAQFYRASTVYYTLQKIAPLFILRVGI